MVLFSMANLRRDPVDPFRLKSVKDCPAWTTKNPVSMKEKQGPQKLRAMADPLLKKIPCPALGHYLRVLRPKTLPREIFRWYGILAGCVFESKGFRVS
jgi:hypothetical protein